MCNKIDWNYFLHHDKSLGHRPQDVAIFDRKQHGGRPTTSVLPVLARHDLVLLHIMELKLKGLCFDTVREIQAKSQTLLDSHLAKRSSDVILKQGIDAGMAV